MAMGLHTLRSILMLMRWPDLTQAEQDHIFTARRSLRRWRKRDRLNRKGRWVRA